MTDFQPRTGFETCFRVRFNECDPNGHVNNAVYLNFLEQAAIDHSAAVGWSARRLAEELGAVWVARKHEIEFRRPAFVGDVLLVQTWPAEMSGARAYRRYEVHRIGNDASALRPDRVVGRAEFEPIDRAELLVMAMTEWAFIDVVRQRPLRVPEVLGLDFVAD